MSELSKIVNKATDAIINGQVLSTEGINDLAKIFYAAANKIIEAGGSAGLKREVVQQLPTEDIDESTIYMVLDSSASGSDIYDEWMWIESAWEHIGSTRVDLSDYYTKTQVDTALSDFIILIGRWFNTPSVDAGQTKSMTISFEEAPQYKNGYRIIGIAGILGIYNHLLETFDVSELSVSKKGAEVCLVFYNSTSSAIQFENCYITVIMAKTA